MAQLLHELLDQSKPRATRQGRAFRPISCARRVASAKLRCAPHPRAIHRKVVEIDIAALSFI